ncbi:hypothetical protein EH31_04465 [Erythrobacter longus]|uniref:Lipoprotein n=1 Tax=Erythrobacter longus TaxID=1044 RepID=A0A074MAT4_ERYLO|nr:hypothetical protein [Erythrobacter longus]KEO91931.1 hypothetical protein EH31_04465 [Erythrobacter longus]
MFKLAAFPIALALAAISAPVAAQTSPTQEGGEWTWEEQESDRPKTWYVMISVHQAVGPAGCDTYRYKVSSVEPIKITGPSEIRPAHADELAGWWMMYVAQRAPLPFRWLTTSAGHEPPEMYFRETREEAMEAFRADGHLRQSRSCSGSKLVGLRTRNFEFTPPPGFTSVDFGNEPAPQGVTVARDLNKAPGAR